jgi:hypothetical protein
MEIPDGQYRCWFTVDGQIGKGILLIEGTEARYVTAWNDAQENQRQPARWLVLDPEKLTQPPETFWCHFQYDSPLHSEDVVSAPPT